MTCQSAPVRLRWVSIALELRGHQSRINYSQRISITAAESENETVVETNMSLPSGTEKLELNDGRRGSQVVRHGSAKAAFVGSIPTLASNSNCFRSNELIGWESRWLTEWLTTLALRQIVSTLCPLWATWV
jgi:hypothetical protein